MINASTYVSKYLNPIAEIILASPMISTIPMLYTNAVAVRIEIGQLQKRLIILRKSTISEVNIIVKT